MRARATFHPLGQLPQRHNAGDKDRLFEEALNAVEQLLLESAEEADYSVSTLLNDVFSDKVDANLEKLRQALRPNKSSFVSCFSSEKQFSATGEKLLAYLAAIDERACLHPDGSVNVAVTHATIRRLLGDGQLPLDRSAIQNMKLDAQNPSLNVYGKNRRASVHLSEDSTSLNQLREANRAAVERLKAGERGPIADLQAARAFNAEQVGRREKAQGGKMPDPTAAPPLCMWLNLEDIPQLKASHTVFDSKELTGGDMHANAVRFLHEGVTKGYFAIKNEAKWLELMAFIENAVPVLSAAQRARMQKLEEKISELSKPMPAADFQALRDLKEKKEKKPLSPQEQVEYKRLVALDTKSELPELKSQMARLRFIDRQAQRDGAIAIAGPYEFNRRFRQLLVDAVYCPDAATGCKIRFGGDLVGDGGQNDLYIYTLLEFLLENGIQYSIIFSNHDAEAMVWLHSGCDLAKVQLQHTEGGLQNHLAMTLPHMSKPGEMQGSKYQSVVPLDVLCEQDEAFRRDLQAQVRRVYIDHQPRLAELSEGGAIMYTHAPVSGELLQEMIEYAVPQVANAGTATQVAALNAWFAEVLGDSERYLRETRWLSGANLGDRKVSPLIRFLTHVGGDVSSDPPAPVNLEPPQGVEFVVHCHTKSILGLTATGEIDPEWHRRAVDQGLGNGWFLNPQRGPQYYSLDSHVGEMKESDSPNTPDNKAGHCPYFALPMNPDSAAPQARPSQLERPPGGVLTA